MNVSNGSNGAVDFISNHSLAHRQYEGAAVDFK
jgi:hypothetical protein